MIKRSPDRNEYLLSSIKDHTYKKWLDAEIVDFDFCSCLHDTTYEDDVISLKYHERTWEGGLPTSKELIWNGEPDSKRAAISFLIRYFRFGGRKAAYRLIHPTGHRIRFKYDNDVFYFFKLPQVLQHLWPDCENEYPNLMRFIKMSSRYLNIQSNETDAFLSYYANHDKTYYTDVFPN